MKRPIIAFVLALVLAVPGLAMACSVTDVDAAFNCDGWTATVYIDFDENDTEITLDFSIALLDAAEEPLEFYAERFIIAHPGGTGTVTHQVVLTGLWQGFYEQAPFSAAVAADVTGASPYGFIQELDCIVADDDVTWDQIKSIYR